MCTRLRVGRPKRLKDLRSEVDIGDRAVTNAVNLLEQAGMITAGRHGFSSCTDDADVAVGAALDLVAIRERVDRSRVEMMRGYAEARQCRRWFLLAYFGQSPSEPCGNCDRCSEGAGDDSSPQPESSLAADAAVDHRDWGPGVVISTDADRITVLFDEYGYRTLALDAVLDNGVLTTR